jgi:hypothetical protein
MIDSGSALSIIDKDIWKAMNNKQELKKVPYSLRSVTQHTLEILGQQQITLRLFGRKRGRFRDYKIQVLVARGLTHNAIMGLDFMKKYNAEISFANSKLVLFMNGTKFVHELKPFRAEERSICIILEEQTILEARTEKRITLNVNEEIDDGTLIYFEPNENVMSDKQISVAAVIDVV